MRGNQVGQRIRPTGAVVGKLRLLALPLAVVAFLAFASAPAFAAKTHQLVKTFTHGAAPEHGFGPYLGLGVDEASENVLVANSVPIGNQEGNYYRVDITGPEGEEPSGVASPFSFNAFQVPFLKGFARSTGLAVDNSPTSPAKGTLYVPDIENQVVKKFTLNPLSEEYEQTGTLTATNPLAIAVDTKGNILVVEEESKSIVKFSPAGSEIGQIPVGFFTEGVAVDGKGDLYVQEAPQSESSLGKVIEFPANGSGEVEPGTQPIEIASGDGSSLQANPASIAADQSANEFYVAFRDHVEQFDSSGNRIGEFETNTIRSELIAVNGQSGLVYVFGGDLALQTPGVAVFGPTVIAPDATTEAVSDLTVSSATLKGTVNAAGALPATCEFEYADDASFKAEGFEGATTAPCSPAGPFTGSVAEPVSAAIGALATQTIYHYRLVASSANGATRGKTLRFFTPGPPFINGESVSELTGTSATLEALVNPASGATSYVFEYVTEADFEVSEYAKATSVPLGGEAIGSGFEDVAVSQPIAGLTPSTNYIFRVVATNPLGTKSGPDRLFTTLGPNGFELPDGRVFEQVTPVDKDGSAPTGSDSLIQAAADGNRLLYMSKGGFPGSEGAQKYPSLLASRGSDWSSRGLLPPASAGPSAGILGWSDDLSRTYLVQAGLGAELATARFLERDSTTHALRTIAGGGNEVGSFNYVGGSADGSAVFFESNTVLYPGGAAKSPNLYAWDKASEELRLAGAFNTGMPTKGTLAGSNELGLTGHFLQAQHTVSADGSRVFFSDVASGQLYLRQNPTQPQSIVDGAGKCTEAALACTVRISASQRAVPDPKGSKAPTFWGASVDGSKSFFTSPTKLTDDATTGPSDGGNDLYRYDADTGVLTDLTPDATDPNGAEVRGVLGTSDDGSYVYFAANGVLTNTPNSRGQSAVPGDCNIAIHYGDSGSGSCNLYLLHDGAAAFIAPLEQASSTAFSDGSNWLSLVVGTANVQRTARVTADGHTLLFRSQLPLTGYDNEVRTGQCTFGKVCPEFFRYDAAADELECVSCNPSGDPPVGLVTQRSLSFGIGTGPPTASILTRNLSADGDRVFFETPDKLVASDTNGDDGCPKVGGLLLSVLTCQDVYEWEAKGTGSCHSSRQNGGCLYLISTGTSSEAAYFADADTDGDNAFFYTELSLVGQDKDQIVDLYDARVGGGIASQNPSPPPPLCEGEACKGSVPAAPVIESPGSASFAGPANPKPARHKKKQHKKKQKKQQHKKHHSAKRNG